jgi:hypothetical protein
MDDSMHPVAMAAIRRACQFLVDRQDDDGFWRDYCALPPGPSSQWVTAFVGHALLCARFALEETESVNRALFALRSSCRPTGWSYNPAVATDADTTSWVIRLFVRANAELPIEPLSTLAAYLSPEGGARTFICGSKYGRWTIEHLDVTAVLGLAMKESGALGPELERLRRWTLDQRNGDGIWISFWWTFDAYATARMLEFLAATGGIPVEVVEASSRYLQGRSSTTAMETANLLMMASGVGANVDSWVSLLLGSQRADGRWPPSRVLKVPDQKKASENETAFEDGNSLMSTAMSVLALTEVLRNHCDRA